MGVHTKEGTRIDFIGSHILIIIATRELMGCVAVTKAIAVIATD